MQRITVWFVVCPAGFLRVGEGTLATYEIAVFGAVGASACSCQKEHHEDGRKGPNIANIKDSGPSGLFLVRVRRSIMRRAGSAPTLQKARFWIVEVFSGLCQKEYQEMGRKCPNIAKSLDSVFVGRPGPSPTSGPLPTGSGPGLRSLPRAFPEPWQPTDPTYWTKPYCTALTDWLSSRPDYRYRWDLEP